MLNFFFSNLITDWHHYKVDTYSATFAEDGTESSFPKQPKENFSASCFTSHTELMFL